jgi:hypothetical protein
MPDNKDGIIAASPMVQGNCEAPHRIVIRDLGHQYVVHTQIFDGAQKPYFHQGDYVPKLEGSQAMPPAEALVKAWARFEERVRRTLQLPRPDQKAQQIADIAETIIKTLMGDGEEHLRDEFENDYQLDSDVETFENLTGKTIRPVKEEGA